MEQYEVGLVGCGVISAAHLKAFRKTVTCHVRGVFDVNRSLAEKRAKEFSIGKIYDRLEDLIAECDIVDVCTPPQTHAPIAQQVIKAGKHLLIEKPLVTDLADWEELLALTKGAPGSITVVHNLKFLRSVQIAKRWVDQGRIGRIIGINRQFLTGPETDRMLVGNTHWSHKLPGGRWFETLPHELYLTHYFSGALDLSGVTAVHTSHAPAGAPADEVFITLKGNDCISTIHFSANCQLNKRVLTLYGTQGLITIDLLSDFASITTTRDRHWLRAIGTPLLTSINTLVRWIPDRISYVFQHLRGQSPHANIIQAFDRYLQGQGPLPTPLEEIDYVVRNGDKIGREIDKQLAGMIS
jgi:predicted dehydrogenase